MRQILIRASIGLTFALGLWPALVAAQARPDPVLTPGAINPAVTTALACATAWGADRRHVTPAMKVFVAVAYHLARADVVAYGRGPCCEFDHLIPRELGGADDVKNLWAQPWAEAKQKDRLENRLHALVCVTPPILTLAAAQVAIATDWVTAYQQYVK